MTPPGKKGWFAFLGAFWGASSFLNNSWELEATLWPFKATDVPERMAKEKLLTPRRCWENISFEAKYGFAPQKANHPYFPGGFIYIYTSCMNVHVLRFSAKRLPINRIYSLTCDFNANSHIFPSCRSDGQMAALKRRFRCVPVTQSLIRVPPEDALVVADPAQAWCKICKNEI